MDPASAASNATASAAPLALLIGRSGGSELRLPPEALLRHAVVLGSSGSGKTVACKAIVEECVRAGIPVIAVDPQGDIASLAEVAGEADVVARGTPAEVRAEFAARAEVVVWTPGSALGVPVSVHPLAATAAAGAPGASGVPPLAEEEALREAAFASEALADAAGFDLRSEEGRTVAAIFGLAIRHAQEEGRPLDGIDALVRLLDAMPKDLADRVASVADERLIGEAVRRARLLAMGPQSLLFSGGVPLDIAGLLGRAPPGDPRATAPGKTRLSVVYVNTLGTERERQFFVGQLAQAVYRFMLRNPAPPGRLQALFYVDEIAPYLPPVRRPICKGPLELLFRQGRKYGIGMLAATQSPGDIDYKALAQVSTWLLGRLLARQEQKKVESVLRSVAPDVAEQVAAALPGHAPGRFTLVAPDRFHAPVELELRWLVTRHRTLDERGIAGATDPALRRRLEEAAGIAEDVAQAPRATSARGGEEEPEERALAGPAVGRAEVAVLSVTASGEGAVNPCEVVVARGSGRITALGSQSRVSKESIRVAWEAAAQLQAELDLPRSFVRRYDVTVLDTRLAVKKDGPSAGLAYFAGIVAALRGTPPRPDVAVTGEITILGKVLAVSAIEEKVRAAVDAGFATVVIPAENAGDAATLSADLRNAIEIVPVATVREALSVVFAAPRRSRPEPSRNGRAGGAGTKTEQKGEGAEPAPRAPIEDRVLDLLSREPRALGYAEIAGRLGASESSVAEAVRALYRARAIERAQRGRTLAYYHPAHRLRPEYGLFGPVDAAKLCVLEPEARRRVQRELATALLFFEREEIASLRLRWLPLYRVRFHATAKEGWLFRREVERRDNLYFHGVTGDLLTYAKGRGIDFAAEIPESPLDVADLDDVAFLQSQLPGELELDDAEMRALLDPAAIVSAATRKFPLTVLETDLIFIPVWRALIRDKKNRSERDFALDGIEGRPIAHFRAAPPKKSPPGRSEPR